MFWDLTTPRLLVMEFCKGGKVDDLQYMKRHKIPVDKVMNVLIYKVYVGVANTHTHILILSYEGIG